MLRKRRKKTEKKKNFWNYGIAPISNYSIILIDHHFNWLHTTWNLYAFAIITRLITMFRNRIKEVHGTISSEQVFHHQSWLLYMTFVIVSV